MSIENIMAGAADAIKVQYESAKKHVNEAVDSVAHSVLAQKVGKVVAEIFEAFHELAQAFVSFAKSFINRKVEVLSPQPQQQNQGPIPQDAKFYEAPQPVSVEETDSSDEDIADASDEDVSVEGSNEESSDEVESEDVSSEEQVILPAGVESEVAPVASSYKKAALKVALLASTATALGYGIYKAYDEGYLSEDNLEQFQSYMNATVAHVTLT